MLCSACSCGAAAAAADVAYVAPSSASVLNVYVVCYVCAVCTTNIELQTNKITQPLSVETIFGRETSIMDVFTLVLVKTVSTYRKYTSG